MSNEREEVEQDADYEMIAYHAQTRGAAFARSGDISKGMAIMKGYKRGM